MSEENDDEELAIRMMCGDKEALREVLKRHLEAVRSLLAGTYGTTVHAGDLDEAVNRAIFKMWRKAGSYDKSRGDLGLGFTRWLKVRCLTFFDGRSDTGGSTRCSPTNLTPPRTVTTLSRTNR